MYNRGLLYNKKLNDIKILRIIRRELEIILRLGWLRLMATWVHHLQNNDVRFILNLIFYRNDTTRWNSGGSGDGGVGGGGNIINTHSVANTTNRFPAHPHFRRINGTHVPICKIERQIWGKFLDAFSHLYKMVGWLVRNAGCDAFRIDIFNSLICVIASLWEKTILIYSKLLLT